MRFVFYFVILPLVSTILNQGMIRIFEDLYFIPLSSLVETIMGFSIMFIILIAFEFTRLWMKEKIELAGGVK